MPDTSLHTELISCLRGLKALARKEAAKQDMSMNAFIAMRVIGQEGGVTMRELADHLDVTPGACTQLVDRLAEQGLVARRTGTDRRSVFVELTDAGVQRRAQIVEATRVRFEAVLAHVPAELQDELSRSVTALARAFETMQPTQDGELPICPSPNPAAPPTP
jgi:DNA-binding MarR family transcriptional regulator